MTDPIIRSQEGQSRFIRRHEWDQGETLTGVILTLHDGSEWFHPYNGSTPVLVKAAGDPKP